MSTREIFVVPATGVGRKDFSQNIELSVQPVIRSHLKRYAVSGESTLPTIAYPNAWAVQLPFTDAAGNTVLVVPDDVKYVIYGVKTTGRRTALTMTGLVRIHGIPPVLEEICTLFGYGEAEQSILKGHVLEPGYEYYIYICQWSEAATYVATYHVQGLADIIVG